MVGLPHLQTFALSVAEMGSLLTLNPQDSTEFVHDPMKGKEYVTNHELKIEFYVIQISI